MDISRVEQIAFCLRFVDDDLIIQEHFYGFWKTATTTSAALLEIVQRFLDLHNLFLKNIVGQCYDGAATMSGCTNGLSTLICNLNEKALYIHCYAHKLNLALQDSCSKLRYIRDVIDLANKLHDFVEGSGQRHGLFQCIQGDEHTTTLKHLSDTRWSSRSKSFDAIVLSYPSLLLFLQIVDENNITKSGALAAGLLVKLKSYKTLFLICLLKKLFSITNVLSSQLQTKDLTVIDVIDLASATIVHLSSLTESGSYEVFKEVVNN
jgi:hypothetical protein